LREKYPDVPWQEMAGMRDRIIHGYDTVDYKIVWDTVRNAFQLLDPKFSKSLKIIQTRKRCSLQTYLTDAR